MAHFYISVYKLTPEILDAVIERSVIGHLTRKMKVEYEERAPLKPKNTPHRVASKLLRFRVPTLRGANRGTLPLLLSCSSIIILLRFRHSSH